MLKKKLNEIISAECFTINEAKALSGYDWEKETACCSEEQLNDIEVFFLFVDGFVEEVEEGFVDGVETDFELLEKAKTVYKMLT